MGCFSVYCGISKIAITAGMRCCILPIAKPDMLSEDHDKLPTALPVFGKYDDYGGIEDIQKDTNTDLLEQHFNVSIEDFCYYLTRGCIDRGDISEKLKENKEAEAMDFMFIHGDVWDVMSSSKDPSDIGRLEFGEPNTLRLLGFEYVGQDGNGRFNKTWARGDKTLQCDGRWCRPSIYAMSGWGWGETSFDKAVGIRPEDEWLLKEDDISILSRIDDEQYLIKKLSSAIGGEYRLAKDLFAIKERKPDFDIRDFVNISSVRWKYMSRVLEFREQLQQVARLSRNMKCMSGEFLPHNPYLTPQCGDHKRHQHFLDAFAEINRSIVLSQKEEACE